MTAAEVFRRILGALDSAGIPYMLTGSFASSYHGTPRATQDIDLVIAPERAQLRRLAALLPPPDFYMDEAAALAAYDAEDHAVRAQRPCDSRPAARTPTTIGAPPPWE